MRCRCKGFRPERRMRGGVKNVVAATADARGPPLSKGMLLIARNEDETKSSRWCWVTKERAAEMARKKKRGVSLPGEV